MIFFRPSRTCSPSVCLVYSFIGYIALLYLCRCYDIFLFLLTLHRWTSFRTHTLLIHKYSLSWHFFYFIPFYNEFDSHGDNSEGWIYWRKRDIRFFFIKNWMASNNGMVCNDSDNVAFCSAAFVRYWNGWSSRSIVFEKRKKVKIGYTRLYNAQRTNSKMQNNEYCAKCMT